MREILFRAKAINRGFDKEYRTNYKNGDWVYGLVTTMYDDRFSSLPAKMKNTDGVNGIDVDYKTIGEYTGLTDKNGTKIFEGDIIQSYHHGEPMGVASVYWSGASFGCNLLSGSQFGYGTLDDWNFDCSLEIIGNVYDNPELIS